MHLNLAKCSKNQKILNQKDKMFFCELPSRHAAENETFYLDDIFQTSLCLSTYGKLGNGNFDELLAGIKRVNGFIFSESYHIDKAIVCASKAAYLSALIKNGASHFERYTDPSQIKNWQIEQTSYNKLNKLKSSNPEAFFYWYKACLMN